MIEPTTAVPSAPATWRVTSFMAEATPDFSSGTAPMIDSVAGPGDPAEGQGGAEEPDSRAASTAMSGAQVSVIARFAAEAGEAGRDDARGAEARDEPDAGDGADDEAEGERHHRGAGLERRVAVRVLQELRDREDRAEEGEERDADRGRRDGEARVAEEGQVEQRVLRAQLPGDEQRGERGEAGEAAEDQRAQSSRASGASMTP